MSLRCCALVRGAYRRLHLHSVAHRGEQGPERHSHPGLPTAAARTAAAAGTDSLPEHGPFMCQGARQSLSRRRSASSVHMHANDDSVWRGRARCGLEAVAQRPQRAHVSGEGRCRARQDRVSRPPGLLRNFGLPCGASYLPVLPVLPVLSAGMMAMLCLARAGLPGCGKWP